MLTLTVNPLLHTQLHHTILRFCDNKWVNAFERGACWSGGMKRLHLYKHLMRRIFCAV